MEVRELEISTLLIDPDFNCRGAVTATDVTDLVASIRKNGLQQPIIVQEYNEELKKALGYFGRVVAGFRRITAFKVLEKKTIPAVVRQGLSESEARILNLVENVNREDLNIVQEARALEKIYCTGLPQKEVAERLNVGTGWLQVRYMVLSFPNDIQEECAKGLLNQSQIRTLHQLPVKDQYEAIKTIKDKKLRGEKNILISKPISANTKKARIKSEMNKMLEHIMDTIGPSFGTRTLAWASGNISSRELFNDIQEYCDEHGINYKMPEQELV